LLSEVEGDASEVGNTSSQEKFDKLKKGVKESSKDNGKKSKKEDKKNRKKKKRRKRTASMKRRRKGRRKKRREEREHCDNPPRKIPYYRLRPIHFGH
jgi:hypothetical protein